VLRVDANHAHHAAPVDHLALVTNFLTDARTFISLLLDKSPAASISGGLKVKSHPPTYTGTRCGRASDRTAKAPRRPCPRRGCDKILAHLPGNVREHLVLILELDHETSHWAALNDRRHHFDGVFLRVGRVGLALIRFGSLPICPLARSPRRSLHFAGTRHTQGPFEVTATVCSNAPSSCRRGHRCPVVFEHRIRSAHIHHWLDCEHHAFCKRRPGRVPRNLTRWAPHECACQCRGRKITNDRIAVLALGPILHAAEISVSRLPRALFLWPDPEIHESLARAAATRRNLAHRTVTAASA